MLVMILLFIFYIFYILSSSGYKLSLAKFDSPINEEFLTVWREDKVRKEL
jgi:hypothetical protein